MGDKLLTVCSPNHHEVLVSGLWNLFSTKQGLDFDFQWGGHSILAHKLMVDVFLSPSKLLERTRTKRLEQRDRRKQPPMESTVVKTEGSARQKTANDAESDTEKANGSADEKIEALSQTEELSDDKDPADLDVLLEFLYNGKVTIQEQHIDKLYDVAKQLDFKLLVDAVEATKKMETRRHTRRRQRKGNPTKLVQYKETSDGESNEEWSTPPKKRARLAKGRKKVYVTEESSEEEEEEDEEEEPVPPESESEEPEEESEEEDFEPPPPKCVRRTPPPKKATTRAKTNATSRKPRKPRQKKSAGDVAAAQSKVDRRTLWRQSQPLLKCEHCSYESRHKSRFEIHRAKHDPTIQVFRCETCSRAFVSEDQLETHKTQAHGNGATVGIHQCPHCEYKTRDKGWFQVHLSKHDPTVVVHRCETCGNPYSSQESLERHKVTQHGAVAKTYKCSRCAFETEVKTKYYQHLYSTHKVNGYGEPMKERYKCPDCDYTCSFRSALKKHGKTHAPDKAFKCEQCDYASSHQGHVYRHVRTAHLHIKPYICEICGHRSATRCHLDRHIQTHTGAKPYKCDVCGQCYADRRYLNDHLRSHVSNEKTYICHICGHASSRREYLNAHLKAVHRAPSETKRGRQQQQQQQQQQHQQAGMGTSLVGQSPVVGTLVIGSPSATSEHESESSGAPPPMAANLPLGLPTGMPGHGGMGEPSMITLQHLAFQNFVCL